ncbi:uncharacterized protein LOC116616152 [Nematostella vectensis]|uniref:uncharacterized protein LOC116616152 n=1 Tax=Nematostella vectensis TaxID=45351 RepID=UPI0013901126|nr:uncharacterized protein LOC116616152 [Nematostella vectensis]XP_032233967.1 uncharacterized protein LOC116616152 [Nematostella vectensis]XP_048583282.1 uncharacterized protein LOC116616152 [Nematostella vectensis]
MLRGRKGKLVINTPPSPIELKHSRKPDEDLKHSLKPVEPAKPVMSLKADDTLRPILVLLLLIGYVDKRFRFQGIFGGIVWILSLTIRCAFDFLSAKKTYDYAWLTIQFLLFAGLAICTYSVKGKAMPWLEKGLHQLEGSGEYLKTCARLRKVFRGIPLVVIAFSLFATGLEFFCYWYDNAFSVSFEQKVPAAVEIFLKAVWFVTNVHVLYAFASFWCIAMCNMYITGYSMIDYHDTMSTHLKNKETPITFRQAVHSFAERGTFLKKSASACRVSLAFLVIYSVASLAVNAFYYLYKERKAGYVFFALVPTICSVYPLCLAAWVTKQYKWYLAVVVKAWAERPESTDEDEESEPEHHKKKDKDKKFGRKFTKRIKSARKPQEKKTEDKTFRRRSLMPLRPIQSNHLSNGSYSDTESHVEEIPIRGKLKPLGEKLFPPPRNVHFSSVSGSEDDDDFTSRKARSEGYKSDASSNPSRVNSSSSLQSPNSRSQKDTGKLFPQASQESVRSASASDQEGVTDDDKEKGEKPKVDRKRVMELILRGTAKAVGRLQHRAKLPKFNFEKYISYLQNVIPTVGFDILGINVTWNMVSTLLFLEVSLLALFVQESIFGNQTAQVQL